MNEKTSKELLGVDRVVNIKEEQFPLISFIMPVYNDGDSVEAAITSIFDQDWPSIEVIAVNDGSPDNAKKVLNGLKKKFKNLTVLQFDNNKGACVARNEGAKLAKGKYYAWLPADAKIYPGMVRVWVETLEKFPEYDFLYGGYRFVDEKGTTVMNYWSDTFEPYLLEVANFIDGSFPIKASTYWEVSKTMGQPDGLWDANIKSLQDWDFWLSVVKEGKGKGLYYKDIFFETTMPHPGGLSEDSHQNWLARTRAIKAKHGIPERKICVTAPGAPFFAKYIAHILDADFQNMPSYKDHDYDMIYELGFYPSIAEQCAMVFLHPKYISQYEQLVSQRLEVPLTNAIKVVHLIGTDLLQMRDSLNRLDMEVFKAMLNTKYDHLFTEFEETHKEAKALGLNSQILALPPRKFFETTPFPKDFTVAVYAPNINEALYNVELMEKVAKSLPKIKFKFFGNHIKANRVDGNIEYSGYVIDMDKFISECSCLVRITSHDGLPQAVLEFLSAGRRVIFNHDFKHVNTANKQIDLKAIANAIKEESQKGLDLEASRWIRKNFTKEKFKEKIYSLLNYDPKSFWERGADNWIKATRHYTTKDWEEIEPFVKKINPKSVIDVGCGDGQWSEKFKDIEYLGIDISEKLIKHASKKYPDKEFLAVSLEEAGIDKKVDLAFCYTVFEHIPESNMKQAVDSLKKLAKKAILIEPLNIKTKNYCINHDYDKWFKIKERKQLGPRMLMVVDLK